MIWVLLCLGIGAVLIYSLYHTMFDSDAPSKKNIKEVLVFIVIAVVIVILCFSEAKTGPTK